MAERNRERKQSPAVNNWLAIAGLCAAVAAPAAGAEAVLDAPAVAAQYEIAEFTVRLDAPPAGNPFVDLEFSGDFKTAGLPTMHVKGFVDSQDGRVLRLRFAPDRKAVVYKYSLRVRGAGIDRKFSGELRAGEPAGRGPVIVDPNWPKHFTYAGSGQPFIHLGFTAYNLVDIANDDGQVNATIEYAAANGFNKIRFLLTGYPRDSATRSDAFTGEHGWSPGQSAGVDPWKRPNYGARPGSVNPLPAWLGKPHAYDFQRFQVSHWQKVDRAVRRMRERGIVATCIVTLEKQNLPAEYGRLTDAEFRLYRYAAARLAAFDNVWWDLGNEHNEFRDAEWGNAMGSYVKAIDPHNRLASAHAHAEFFYSTSPWADFIITQQYGSPKEVHEWALKYGDVPKPYINEECGYEGDGLDSKTKAAPGRAAGGWGHLQNADFTRRVHWAIAMAGGYSTYGDWSGGVLYAYMGVPGPGKAARQLTHLRKFFEGVPFSRMSPCGELIKGGFCLSAPPGHFVFYLPEGDAGVKIDRAADTRWFDPRSGQWRPGPRLRQGWNQVARPNNGDWVLYAGTDRR